MASTINASTSSGLISSGDTSGVLALQTNSGTTAVTIDTSQNVGIGTASPTNKLQVSASSDDGIRISATSDTSLILSETTANKNWKFKPSGGDLFWQYSATAYNSGYSSLMTLTASGNVGIGTNSPSYKLDVSLPASTSGIVARFNSPSYDELDVYVGSSKAYIGTASSTPLAFQTANTERMRIETNGNFFYGYTSGDYANSNSFKISTTLTNSGYIVVNHINGSSSGNVYAGFGYNGSAVGTITQNGTTGVLYNLTSDYRLKNNPVALTGAKDFVMALQPKTWDWWDESGKGVGFIAHEFMEVAKYSGQGEKDAVDENGKPVYQSIQPSSSEVMANIVALMQEQQTTITAQAETINALTARIVALEGK